MLVEVPGFEIVSVLGSGASAVVLEARHEGREVALKVAREELGAEARARFAAEAATLRRLAHPSLVPLLAAGVLDDGRPYLCMPLLRGETLAARVARGPLAIEEALRFGREIGGALGALHAAGVVHRDVKPENVMLVDGGRRAVLLDLGIAKREGDAAGTATREGLVRGTPAYMAPERFFGRAASVRSDVYELAVTVFFMLTGTLPWERADEPDDRMVPRDPRERCPALGAATAEAILRALSTRVETRPGSVAELVEALVEDEAATGGEERASRMTAASPRVAPRAGGAKDARDEERSSAAAPSRGRLWWIAVAAIAAAAALGGAILRPSADGSGGVVGAANTANTGSVVNGSDSATTDDAASAIRSASSAEGSAEPAASAPGTGDSTGGIPSGTVSSLRPHPPPAKTAAAPAVSSVPTAASAASAAPGSSAASAASAAYAAPESIPACQKALAIWCAPEHVASRAGPGWCQLLQSDLRKTWSSMSGTPDLRLKTVRTTCETSIPAARASYRTVLGVDAPY